ncbi:MAG: lipoyl(octanoyl) transferase LipB [Gammaproteobacteria bacterium]|nr:lipoyl(octanoyl) transferase LipB [Gammaproteobacteria bacterium]
MTVRQLGLRDYVPVMAAMQAFTEARTADSGDEVWLLEHAPVYTLGRAALPDHVLSPGSIPVVRTDRGGQVTYHGPGQLVMYTLIDLRRRRLGVKDFVHLIERCIIELLAGYGISADRRAGAPGVYVAGAKIAALGLRVRRGCSYHGVSLNVDMDLEPFARINPCGYPGLRVTQLAALGDFRVADLPRIGADFLAVLTRQLNYDKILASGPVAEAG